MRTDRSRGIIRKINITLGRVIIIINCCRQKKIVTKSKIMKLTHVEYYELRSTKKARSSIMIANTIPYVQLQFIILCTARTYKLTQICCQFGNYCFMTTIFVVGVSWCCRCCCDDSIFFSVSLFSECRFVNNNLFLSMYFRIVSVDGPPISMSFVHLQYMFK